jgi:hypothetical protein
MFPASERAKTVYASDSAATVIGFMFRRHVYLPEHFASKYFQTLCFDQSNSAAKQLNQEVYHIKFLAHTRINRLCTTEFLSFVVWYAAIYSLFSNNQRMVCYGIYILKILIWFEVLRSLRMGRGTHPGVGNTFLLTFPCKEVLQSPLGITSLSNYLFITELNKLTFLQNEFHAWIS